jgi:glycolate oxidase FAD binding subunit
VDSSSLSIEQSSPLPIEQPASVAELGTLVRSCRAGGKGIYPFGGRTTLDVGFPPSKPGLAIDMGRLNSVIDYPARDMTITVRAGITMAALQAELAREGQWLPVDVAGAEFATLGGAIALNQSGPHRLGHGTLRDYVIGISFVTDEGVEVKAGGRVVKNVAGYDLMKLQIGALGTLGVITQATLKVKPRPEASALVLFECAGAALDSVLDALAISRSRPVVVEVLNARARESLPVLPASSTAGAWTVAVGFEEKATTVRWQAGTLLDELKALPVQAVQELPEAAPVWAAITRLQLGPSSRYIAKSSVLPSKVADELRKLSAHGPDVIIHAHGLDGIVWCHLRERIDLPGAVFPRAPVEEKKNLPVWGQPPAGWELMRHIKRTLDPDNVMNPGRLFGDL